MSIRWKIKRVRWRIVAAVLALLSFGQQVQLVRSVVTAAAPLRAAAVQFDPTNSPGIGTGAVGEYARTDNLPYWRNADGGDNAICLGPGGCSTSANGGAGGGSYVLSFSGVNGNSISVGNFYSIPNTTLGTCLYEAVVKPGDNAESRFWWSDGAGGVHSMLVGNGSNPSPYTIAGNIWNGSVGQSIQSFDGCYAGEWCYEAVYYDGGSVTSTFIKGVPSGKTPFSGTRQSGATVSGSGVGYIGGSNHSNYLGSIAWVRVWEGATSVPPWLSTANAEHPFVPDILPSPVSYDGTADSNAAWTYPTGLWDFTGAANRLVPDLSAGWNGAGDGGVQHHPGVLGGDISIGFGKGGAAPTRPTPLYVYDSSAPTGLQALSPQTVGIATPVAAPSGSYVWDSFSRADTTYWDVATPTLSSTEGGTQGVQAWNNAGLTLGGPFGVFSNRAVYLNTAGVAGNFQWVGAGHSDFTVKVKRNVTNGTGDEGACNTFGALTGDCSNTGLVWRLDVNAPTQNYCYTYTYVSSGSAPATRTACLVNGVDSGYAFVDQDLTAAHGFDTFRVDANGTTVTLYTCASGVCTARRTYTSVTPNQTKTGVGIYAPVNFDGRMRWDRFCAGPVAGNCATDF